MRYGVGGSSGLLVAAICLSPSRSRLPTVPPSMELCLRTESSGLAPGQGDPLQGLVAMLATGDEHALASLYEQTSQRVYGLALRVVKDRSAAEEVVLDVYAQVWRQAERYD